ncbi:LysM peptidoglycan-binding domain-containing protein [uncultured Aliiroseovarius sp.]|uniref:LysM peptidoglycan-binding domain-containing protein n=1 Tax=uncultured Aliiroseovarius sp. TaxID=1658783 RepID=UPI00260E93C0|nr:LysM peptidoglycan-binding domain-containing protein [uncultured Aliiroseovarius sp.]
MTAETGGTGPSKGLLIAGGVAIVLGLAVLGYVMRPDPAPMADTTADQTTDTTPGGQVAITQDATTPDAADATPPAGLAGFDVVRVDPEGRAVVAGHGTPGSTLQLTINGAPLETVIVDADGNFVTLLDMPADTPGTLGLDALDETGAVIEGGAMAQTVLIEPAASATADDQVADAGPAPETGDATAPTVETGEQAAAPRVLLADDQGIAVLQDGTGRPAVDNVVIDAISYDEAGEVALSGRGQGGGNVRVYLDNTPVQTAKIAEDGQWRLPLPEVEGGVYTLRVDELSDDGTVLSRTETPFKREEPEQLAEATAQVADAAARVQAVTVQPGFTLWAIARDHLGDGPLYVRVFEANRDQIRNPDLIYPGQVFKIPDAN